MNSPKETDQVFHPLSVPIDRSTKQREDRKRSYRFCFYATIVLLALFGAIVIVGGVWLASKLLEAFLFPTKQHALKAKHVDRLNTSQVHPLIDTTSTIDIQATVFQDVTDLLARGEQLPQRGEPWQLVETVIYSRALVGPRGNYTRTEAVLYSGKIAQGATVQSKIHTSVPLRVPIAPLYTTNLGRSSLRAAFSIAIPEERAQAFGAFRNVSYMIAKDLPFLPRRLDSEQVSSEHDLNTALADAGITTSLLELVPSPWYRTRADGEPNRRTIDNGTAISPFFSLHPKNLVRTLLHLERPANYNKAKWWRRNPLAFRRRRLTTRERKSIALANTTNKLPFFILFLSISLFCLVQEHRFFQFTSTAGTCTVDDYNRKAQMWLVEKLCNKTWYALSPALLNCNNVAQAWFNYKSGTFTGSFRISAVGSAILLWSMTFVMGMESLSSWADKTHVTPFGVDILLELVAPAWLAYQALTYKGVPQVEPHDDDEE